MQQSEPSRRIFGPMVRILIQEEYLLINQFSNVKLFQMLSVAL